MYLYQKCLGANIYRLFIDSGLENISCPYGTQISIEGSGKLQIQSHEELNFNSQIHRYVTASMGQLARQLAGQSIAKKKEDHAEVFVACFAFTFCCYSFTTTCGNFHCGNFPLPLFLSQNKKLGILEKYKCLDNCHVTMKGTMHCHIIGPF